MPNFLEYEIRVRTKDSNSFELLYSTTTPLPEYKVINPVLNLEESAAGSLEFKLPPANTFYEKIGMMTSTIRVYCKSGNNIKEEIWEGRPLKTDEDMFKNHKIVCEGALSYLNDVYQPQAKYTDGDVNFLNSVIDIYNARAASHRQFEIGSVSVDYGVGGYDFEETTSYESTLSVLNNFCTKYGCYMYTERNQFNGKLTIHFRNTKSRNGENDTQTIEFGKNLTDYARNFDFSNMVSVVLPLGAKIEKDKEANARGNKLTPYDHWPATGVEMGYVIANPPSDTTGQTPLLTVSDKNYKVYSYKVNPGDVVFISSQMHNGHTFWTLRTPQGSYISNCTKTVPNKETMQVADNTKVTIPTLGVSNNSILYVGVYEPSSFTGFGVYAGLKADEVDELDEYINIADKESRDDVRDAHGNHIAWVHTDKGSMYAVCEEALAEYGWIERKIEFSSETNVTQLYVNARKYLTSDRFDGMQIDVTAYDLRALGDDNATNLKVGQRIHVIAKPYSLDTYMPITKLQIPLDNASNMKYTLGSTSNQSLTSVNNSLNSDLMKQIAAIPAASSIISTTKKNMVNKIIECNSSYVTIKYANGTDKAEAIIISDTQNYQQSSKGYWIWNAAGLAFIDGNGDPHNAMTDDGQMYADIITTGTMAADRILGGTLKIGHWNNTDGELQMKDNSGNVILSVDKSNGITSEDPSSHYKAVVRGGEIRFVNPNDASGGFIFAPGIANRVFTDGQGNPLYRCLSLYGQRIGFNCNNFWVFSNGSWYATDEGVRTVTLDGKRLTFVNGILKEVENV